MKEHHLSRYKHKKARLFQMKADDSLAKESSAFIWNENPNARGMIIFSQYKCLHYTFRALPVEGEVHSIRLIQN